MLLALVALALTQCGPDGPVFSCPSTMGGLLPTFSMDFSAAGAECTCAASVAAGTNGEAITNVQDGGAYCTAGDWLTGIPTGAMAFCPSDAVRVMNGTGDGGVGFMSESSMHNYNESQDFTGAPWANIGTGGLDPPIISPPDAGPCPDGTITATRIQLPANTIDAPQQSIVYNLTGCQGGSGIGSGSYYLRGYAADGGTAIQVASTRIPVYYSANSWTRVVNEGVTMNTTGLNIGNTGYYLSPQVAFPAADFFVCFAQCETNPTVTSYHPTTRDADRLRAEVLVPLGSDLAMTATVLPEGTSPAVAQFAIGYDYATWFASESDSSGGMHVRNTWSAVDEYVPNDGGKIGSGAFSPRTPAVVTIGWESVGPVSGGAPAENYSGVGDGCFNATCIDGGLTYTPLASISANSELIEFGGHQSAVDWSIQPNAIIKALTITSHARKNVFVYGDSIVGGANAAEVEHNMMWAKSGSAVSWQNHGQSGMTIDQCKTAWDATVAAVKAHPSIARSTWMLVQCGTNSPTDGGYVLAQLEAMYQAGRDAGVHVVGSTITPRGDHCDFVTYVNANLRAYGAANGFPIAETFNSALWTGSDCDPVSDLYFDSVHPNDAGTIVMWNKWDAVAGW